METNRKKYYITTYGCQMNLHESEKIAGILCEMGYELAENEKEADIIVFNTCCIRENAEDRAEGNIGALKQLKRKNKDLIIAVGGCMTQQEGYADKLLEKLPFIDIVFGTHNLEQLRPLIEKRLNGKKHVKEVWEKEGEIVENTPKTRTSYPNAWVNIVYGCNNFCTYCIVPYVRGRERSRKPEDIINECRSLIKEGYKEITLLGQNVNSYGKDLGTTSFADLINEIAKIDGKFRLRFMTNHPKDFSLELIEALKNNPKVCKVVHLPVQAGSNRILKLMNRHYTREDYLSKIKLLRENIPDMAVTTDIMVGFPTETEEDFLDTLNLVKEVGFSGAFTFIYSKRNGTPAAKMDGQIDEETSKRRIMQLIDVQNTANRNQSKGYLGKTIEILCEGYDEKRGKYLGRDVYGRMAYFSGDESLLGQFVNVKITKTGGMSLLGDVVKD
ncbi:MAG: tRNA (N6-isopentenyl adenosine(37)-C2)-methylthiotransferase MiaB [Clostridia bacterium]|nr:tRNA (N6-isopentenyl adenosine(37)-C2)-methylthiotransferase MiaB [Clostridia bacterium]